MKNIITDWILTFWIFIGTKFGFKFIDVYCEDLFEKGEDADVTAITFSKSNKYIDLIQEIEEEQFKKKI